MKAVIYEEFKGNILLRELPDPSPETNGVVLKVFATGMCLSDWHGWQGHDKDIVLPHVPGHELAGEIVSKGKEVKNFDIGERVTVPFVGGCGTCYQCHSGNHQVCDNQSQPGFTHWGSFAEYVRIDYADINLVRLPEEITNETASILGCRFITAYRAVVQQGNLKGGNYVAIHGCGGVGLSAIMIANALGAQVIAIDIKEASLDLAKQLGATWTINATEATDIVGQVKEISKGGVHISIDGIGSQETCFNSISNLRKRGKHIQVGLMTGTSKHPKIPMDEVLSNELEILGSHGMQAHKYPEMLAMIQAGILKPEKLIEREISLEKSVKLLPKMNEFEHSGVLVINSF